MIGERDLDFLIDSIEYDHLEDNADVQGSWRIARDPEVPSIICILYQPYDDRSQDTYYPPKATRYHLTLLDEVEGDEAEGTYDEWLREGNKK